MNVVTEFRFDIKVALDFICTGAAPSYCDGTKIYALFPIRRDPTEYRFLAKQSYLVLDYHIHFYYNIFWVFVLTPDDKLSRV